MELYHYIDIDDYINRFPDETQQILNRIRSIIKNTAPEAQEAIAYGTPVFNLNGGHLIYFAASKKHVSLYPAPRGAEEFKSILARYKGGKGTVRFPIDKPLPEDLIERIIKFRMEKL